MSTMSKVSVTEVSKALAEIDRDLLDQVKGFTVYRETHKLPDRSDRDELYMVERIRILADEWLRWRLV